MRLPLTSRRSPSAEELPLPQQNAPDASMAKPKTPRELEARHRKVKDAVVAIAKMLVPKA